MLQRSSLSIYHQQDAGYRELSSCNGTVRKTNTGTCIDAIHHVMGEELEQVVRGGLSLSGVF